MSVKGASKGEGLGNKFLENIRQVDAIVHVVRAFDDDNITTVSGKVDPIEDIETINMELSLADLESVEKRLAKVQRAAKGRDKDALAELAVLEKLHPVLEAGKPRIGNLYHPHVRVNCRKRIVRHFGARLRNCVK